jgi:FKBP-type peptidyl-prolyl cis-trans isomerase SlyD
VKIEKGRRIKIDYVLKVDDLIYENTLKSNSPLVYIHGNGEIIAGLEDNLLGMEVGEKKIFSVLPEKAYGARKKEAVQEVPRIRMPDKSEPTVGHAFVLKDSHSGHSISAVIVEVRDETMVLDLNHPLAGKTLNYEVKVLEIH